MTVGNSKRNDLLSLQRSKTVPDHKAVESLLLLFLSTLYAQKHILPLKRMVSL